MQPDPRSPYGVSKLAAEHYVHTLGDLHGIETVVLRYFNVFGPGQDPNSEYAAVVPKFVTAGARRRAADRQRHRRRVARLHVHRQRRLGQPAGVAPGEPVAGLTCNIACGDRYSLLELLDAISAATGRPADRSSDRRARATSATPRPTSRSPGERSATRSLVPFKEGIARTVAWYRDNAAAGAAGSGASTGA